MQTTVKQLINQINGNDGIKTVTVAPISYIDYDVDSMHGIPDGNDRVAQLKYKGKGWAHENELRAILLYDMYYVPNAIPEKGEHLAVTDLINRLILAPNALKDYELEIAELLQGTGAAPV